MERDAEFQKHLLETFKLEAEEHLSGITSGLIELEKEATPERQAEIVETVFREAHSLKGAARSVGRSDVESLCQAMEGLFSAIKRGEVHPGPELFDLLQRAADALGSILAAAGEASEEEKSSQRKLAKRLGTAAKGEKVDIAVPSAPAGTGAARAEPPPYATGAAPDALQVPEATARPAAAPTPEAAVKPDPTPSAGARAEVEGVRPPAAAGAAAAAGAEVEGIRPPAGGGQSVGGEAQGPAAPAGMAKAEGAGAAPAGAAAGKGEARSVTPATAETVRVSWSKLSAVLLLSEEMLSAKLSARQRALQMREVRAAFADWKKQWNKLSPDLQKLAAATATAGGIEGRKEVSRVLEFLSWSSAFINTLEARYAAQAKEAEHDSRWLGGMVDNLLADVKKVMMFPFSSLLDLFPKIVRDLSRDSGKEADLVIRGEEIEIDRRILEEMKDPLIHLVRNCIDHGIEKPQEREAKRKSRRGTITINIAPRDDKAEIVVSDDGSGISPALVRGALLKMGVLSAERAQSLSDAELIPFVFQSGLSTSPIITEVSGHGLGLAIVKEKVEKLGGTISLESFPERGTTFRIMLPLSVATFRGILVRVGDRVFVLPATHVDRAVRVKAKEIRTVENRETVTLDDAVLSLERLDAALELPPSASAPAEQLQAVVVTAAEQRMAFLVDEVLGEQEVLLKTLGPQLARVRNIAGATVLGSGKVAPIVNVPDLLKSAARRGAGAAPPVILEAAAAPLSKVLVVDDSITSRTLLKNILESGGYSVATAIDGIDAFTRLKAGDFDIVVSDVDMPRLNGFDLTARIRSDEQLRELPVVLVTALGTREDRERGIDAGANAYIVKSSFDQSDLLEVVKRLS